MTPLTCGPTDRRFARPARQEPDHVFTDEHPQCMLCDRLIDCETIRLTVRIGDARTPSWDGRLCGDCRKSFTVWRIERIREVRT